MHVCVRLCMRKIVRASSYIQERRRHHGGDFLPRDDAGAGVGARVRRQGAPQHEPLPHLYFFLWKVALSITRQVFFFGAIPAMVHEPFPHLFDVLTAPTFEHHPIHTELHCITPRQAQRARHFAAVLVGEIAVVRLQEVVCASKALLN